VLARPMPAKRERTQGAQGERTKNRRCADTVTVRRSAYRPCSHLSSRWRASDRPSTVDESIDAQKMERRGREKNESVEISSCWPNEREGREEEEGKEDILDLQSLMNSSVWTIPSGTDARQGQVLDG
jgi:hypothetical protein